MDSLDSLLGAYRSFGDPDALAREGLFAVEGRLVLPRLLASRYRVQSVLLSEAARASLEAVLAPYPDVRVLVAPADEITRIAGYDFHRGCLALGYRDEASGLEPGIWSPEPVGASLAPVVILESVSNPDNIGGIFRSAHAFGARGVLLGPGCGDPLYRKAIRTSMGATLDVPWTTLTDWPAALATLRHHSHTIVALTTDAAAPPLRDAIAGGTGPFALMLGSEGHGLSPAALAAATLTARIPMPNAAADSLNVTAAASIALYELTQRG